jgi:hypothetical protein
MKDDLSILEREMLSSNPTGGSGGSGAELVESLGTQVIGLSNV